LFQPNAEKCQNQFLKTILRQNKRNITFQVVQGEQACIAQ
jgi:hypothetical protein